MAGRPTELTRFTVSLLILLLGLSFISGLGLWYVHEMQEEVSANAVQGVPTWAWFCRVLHGLLNPAICALFGFLWFAHVRGGWRMRVNRRSGGTMAGLMIALIGTGAALYYDKAGSHLWFSLHLLAGLLIVFALPAHWLAARKWVRETERNREPT
jgi:hypothetical protein